MGWQLLSVLPLGVMMVTDIRSRTVSSWWLLLFAILLWVPCIVVDGWRVFLTKALLNLLMIAFVGLALWGYSLVRRKKLLAMLGLGDILFFLSLAPCFEMKAYLCFLIGSCLLALAVWPVFRKRQPALTGIPLVAVSGLLFVAVLLGRLVSGSYGY